MNKRGMKTPILNNVIMVFCSKKSSLGKNKPIGNNIIDSILGFDGLKSESHLELVELLYTEAQDAINEQIKICEAHLKEEELANGVLLGKIDVEKYAKRFKFPPPGKTTGAIHDNLCTKNPDKGVITLGLGPDFIVLRSKGVIINFPRIIRNLKKKLPGAGIDGGQPESGFAPKAPDRVSE